MDFKDALKNSGLTVPNKPDKIDSKRANMKLKIDRTSKILDKLVEATYELDCVPNKKEFYLVQAKLVLYYQRFCDAIKDLLDTIANKENIQNLSEHRGIGELIRKTFYILGVSPSEQDAIKKLTLRNDVVHDYMNIDFYDETITIQISEDIEIYKAYFNKIKRYFINKNMLK